MIHRVPATGIPDLQVAALVDDDVVEDVTAEPVPQLEPRVQAHIVVDLVIGGTVVQIDAPGLHGGIFEAVVPDDRRLPAIQQRIRLLLRALGAVPLIGGVGVGPEPVAAPRIERPVVARLPDAVPHVIEFDEVPAETAAVHVDARTRAGVDGVMADGNRVRLGDVHAGGLLFKHAQVVHVIGTHHDPHGVIIRQRPGGEIPDARLLARPRRGIARGAHQTHDLHAGRPHVHKQVVIDKVRPVVRAHENPVAAHIRENGILDGDVIGVGHVDCPLARHGPVAAHQSFIRRVEQRPVCLRENEVGQGDIFHRVVGGRAAEAGQFRDRRRFDGGGGRRF